jgi:hypothetical protein
LRGALAKIEVPRYLEQTTAPAPLAVSGARFLEKGSGLNHE